MQGMPNIPNINDPAAAPQKRKKGRGINADGLRLWGIAFVVAGAVGQGLIQTGLLHVERYASNAALLAALEQSAAVSGLATWGILLQCIGYCALPVFVALLVEGFVHTSSLKAYALRLAALAVVCEIPYNLAFGGTLIDTSSRNPVFGLLLCVGVLYLLRAYGGSGLRQMLVAVLLVVVAALWASMLRVEGGLVMVCLAVVLWVFRQNLLAQLMLGCLVCALGSVGSVLRFSSIMGMLCVHVYNGEPGSWPRWLKYSWYPALLVLVGVLNLLL
jgi:hypothetical protein